MQGEYLWVLIYGPAASATTTVCKLKYPRSFSLNSKHYVDRLPPEDFQMFRISLSKDCQKIYLSLMLKNLHREQISSFFLGGWVSQFSCGGGIQFRGPFCPPPLMTPQRVRRGPLKTNLPWPIQYIGQHYTAVKNNKTFLLLKRQTGEKTPQECPGTDGRYIDRWIYFWNFSNLNLYIGYHVINWGKWGDKALKNRSRKTYSSKKKK